MSKNQIWIWCRYYRNLKTNMGTTLYQCIFVYTIMRAIGLFWGTGCQSVNWHPVQPLADTPLQSPPFPIDPLAIPMGLEKFF